jgi:hypothetical protein
MEQEKVDRLAALNGFQLAALALLASSAAALGVLFALRRLGIVGARPIPPEAATQPAVPHEGSDVTPTHFSETLIVPGVTFTGGEVAEQDLTDGRSPEGV